MQSLQPAGGKPTALDRAGCRELRRGESAMHRRPINRNSELTESLAEKVRGPAVLGRGHGRLPRGWGWSEEEETGAQRGISQGPGPSGSSKALGSLPGAPDSSVMMGELWADGSTRFQARAPWRPENQQ